MTAEDLVNLYFERIKAENINIGWKTKIFKEIKHHIVIGIPNETLEKAIREKGELYSVDLIKVKPVQTNKDNLVIDGNFYYHPFLQLAPALPTITINRDGSFTESYASEEFFLKIKPLVTFKDILEYFYKNFEYVMKNPRRDLGAIKYVYETGIMGYVESNTQITINPLDLLLFTIDAARFSTFDRDSKLQKGILGLDDYIDEALGIYVEKINFAKMNKLTFVQ